MKKLQLSSIAKDKGALVCHGTPKHAQKLRNVETKKVHQNILLVRAFPDQEFWNINMNTAWSLSYPSFGRYESITAK